MMTETSTVEIGRHVTCFIFAEETVFVVCPFSSLSQPHVSTGNIKFSLVVIVTVIYSFVVVEMMVIMMMMMMFKSCKMLMVMY